MPPGFWCRPLRAFSMLPYLDKPDRDNVSLSYAFRRKSFFLNEHSKGLTVCYSLSLVSLLNCTLVEGQTKDIRVNIPARANGYHRFPQRFPMEQRCGQGYSTSWFHDDLKAVEG